MINQNYIARYTQWFDGELANCPVGMYDDAALPSYTHKNKLMSWLFWKRINAALTMAGDVSNCSVLDFGCGGGVTFSYLAEKNCRIYGCDKHLGLIRRMCESLGLEVNLCDDVFSLSRQQFDFIFALDVLEHLEDLTGYLQKFKKLSHPKTTLIISGPTENLLYLAGRKLAGFHGDYHVRNIYHIERNLRRSGYVCEKIKQLYFPCTLFRVSAWQMRQ